MRAVSFKVLEGNATYEGGWLNGQKHGNGVLTGKVAVS